MIVDLVKKLKMYPDIALLNNLVLITISRNTFECDRLACVEQYLFTALCTVHRSDRTPVCVCLCSPPPPLSLSLSSMLITSVGHIKLTDFGLSKVGLMSCK